MTWRCRSRRRDDTISPVSIDCQPAALKRALTNLIENAVNTASAPVFAGRVTAHSVDAVEDDGPHSGGSALQGVRPFTGRKFARLGHRRLAWDWQLPAPWSRAGAQAVVEQPAAARPSGIDRRCPAFVRSSSSHDRIVRNAFPARSQVAKNVPARNTVRYDRSGTITAGLRRTDLCISHAPPLLQRRLRSQPPLRLRCPHSQPAHNLQGTWATSAGLARPKARIGSTSRPVPLHAGYGLRYRRIT